MHYEVTGSVVNIRSGPGVEYTDEGDLVRGQIVNVVDIPKEWLAISTEEEDEDGNMIPSVSFASAQFLRKVSDTIVEPVTKPASLVITGKKVVTLAMTQKGDPYIFGFEVDLKDPNPRAFDCSELTQWVCAQLGVVPVLPDGARNQFLHCQKYHTLITIEQAVKTVGALLFRISDDGDHVVISRGDGSTIEAKGKDYGVGTWAATGRGFNHAALIPGVQYQ